MKKKPYNAKVGTSHWAGTRGNIATNTVAIDNTAQVQRIRPRSLRWPNSGLLTTEARKIALKAVPVCRRSKPQAFCINNEPRLPMLLPVKSRKPKSRLIPINKRHKAGEANSFSPAMTLLTERSRAGSSCASQANKPAIRIPSIPSSNTGARHPALSARHPE